MSAQLDDSRVIRILGVDPGSLRTGWGIIEMDGPAARHVAHGCISMKSTTSLPLRLCHIFEGIDAVIAQHGPVESAVEKVFVNRNVDAALKLGQARGAALLAAARAGLAVFELTPAEVKKAIVGSGRAEKPQVQLMVRVLLHLRATPVEDAADALAIALSHGQLRRTRSRLDRAVALADARST